MRVLFWNTLKVFLGRFVEFNSKTLLLLSKFFEIFDDDFFFVFKLCPKNPDAQICARPVTNCVPNVSANLLDKLIWPMEINLPRIHQRMPVVRVTLISIGHSICTRAF